MAGQKREGTVKRALVTGGSRGIGFQIAKILATHGVDVCIAGTDRPRLEAAKSQITEASSTDGSGAVHVAAIDLMQSEAPAQLIKKTVGLLGGLDLLVNNAGISLNASLEETTVDEWDRIMQINARAPFFLCREALVHLRESEAPMIVQIASVVSHEGYAMQSAYAASKHALVGFTKALAKEVQQDGIRIHTLSPGGVATDMIGSMRPDIDTSALIDPAEIAELVWFLVSHRGKAMIDHIDIRRATKTPW